jgi:hypothetical protein
MVCSTIGKNTCFGTLKDYGSLFLQGVESKFIDDVDGGTSRSITMLIGVVLTEI